MRSTHFVRENGTLIPMVDIKDLYSMEGQSLLLGSKTFYFCEVPGLLWNKKIELSRDEFYRLRSQLVIR
jgi:hypothetical protein